MQIKWSVLNRRLLFWREWSQIFIGDDDWRSGWSRGPLSLKLVHFMPDAVRYVLHIWVADYLSWSCSRPTCNIRLWLRPRANCPSGSGSGSASLHHICIRTCETFEKHHPRSNRVSLFALEYTWHCSLAFRRETPARSVTCIPTEKARRDSRQKGTLNSPPAPPRLNIDAKQIQTMWDFRNPRNFFGISSSKRWKSGTLDERLSQHIVFIFSLSRQRWGQMTIWPHLHQPKVGPWPRCPPPPPLWPPVISGHQVKNGQTKQIGI